MYCQYYAEGRSGEDSQFTHSDYYLARRIHNEKGKHYWKCYVNSDINLQYHQIMLQKSRNSSKKVQMKDAAYSLKRYLSGQIQSLERFAGRSKKKYSTLETLRNLRLQKRNGFDKQVTEFQQSQNHEDCYQEEYELVKNCIKTKQYQKTQNKKMQKIQSLKHLYSTPQNNYYSTKTIQSSIRPSTKNKLKTTICNESRESKTTFQQIESSKQTQPDQQINRIIRSETDYGFSINPNKFEEYSSISDQSAHESLIPEQPNTVCKQIQTKQVVVLNKQTYQMQQQQRKYLREKFLWHYQQVHGKC